MGNEEQRQESQKPESQTAATSPIDIIEEKEKIAAVTAKEERQWTPEQEAARWGSAEYWRDIQINCKLKTQIEQLQIDVQKWKASFDTASQERDRAQREKEDLQREYEHAAMQQEDARALCVEQQHFV